jgi:hypothetical protein
MGGDRARKSHPPQSGRGTDQESVPTRVWAANRPVKRAPQTSWRASIPRVQERRSGTRGGGVRGAGGALGRGPREAGTRLEPCGVLLHRGNGPRAPGGEPVGGARRPSGIPRGRRRRPQSHQVGPRPDGIAFVLGLQDQVRPTTASWGPKTNSAPEPSSRPKVLDETGVERVLTDEGAAKAGRHMRIGSASL